MLAFAYGQPIHANVIATDNGWYYQLISASWWYFHANFQPQQDMMKGMDVLDTSPD